MKAILEFSLPEELSEFRQASAATDLYLTIYEFDQKLRGWLKHGHEFATPDDALQHARDALREYMSDNGVLGIVLEC